MDEKQGERLCDVINETLLTYHECILPQNLFPSSAYIKKGEIALDFNNSVYSVALQNIDDAYSLENFLVQCAIEFLPKLRFVIIEKSYEAFNDKQNPYKGVEGTKQFATSTYLIEEYLFAIERYLRDNATDLADWVYEESISSNHKEEMHFYS